MRFDYRYKEKSWLDTVNELDKRMARAATRTMRDIAKIAVDAGRSEIASAGFGSRWQRGLRYQVIPESGEELDPKARIYHRSGIAAVFEYGARISGKPLLWLPIEGATPLGKGTSLLDPAQFQSRVGGLRSVNVPGHPPMLVGQASGIVRATRKAVRFKKKGLKVGNVRGDWIPIFVGVPAVSIPKKYDIRSAVKRAAEQINALFTKYLNG